MSSLLLTTIGLMPLVSIASTMNPDPSSDQIGFAAAFFGGLLTAFTPCVYPVVPLVLAQSGGTRTSKGTAMLNALFLVSGMVLVYTGLGLIAGFGNIVFGSWVGTGLFKFLAASMMALFAFGLLGAYTVSIPTALSAWANRVSDTGRFSAFFVGAVSGLLSAGCTGPVLAGILTYIAASAEPLRASLMMFWFAIGMGLPFLLLSISVSSLPKPGRWMIWVEGTMGMLLLGAGAWFVTRGGGPFSPMFDRFSPIIAASVAVIAAVSGAAFWFRGATTGRGSFRLRAVVAGMLIGIGATLLLSVEQHYRRTSVHAVDWITVTSVAAFDRKVAEHRGRLIVVDFHAEWCGDCVEMERTVLSRQDIANQLSTKFVLIRVDATTHLDDVSGIAERFGAQGVPAFRFISPDGTEMARHRLDGPTSADAFRSLLASVAMSAGTVQTSALKKRISAINPKDTPFFEQE